LKSSGISIVRLSELLFLKNILITIEPLKFQLMGKGDKKTKKGKIFKGSFGKSRPRKKKKAAKK